jgi:hypothetical protein
VRSLIPVIMFLGMLALQIWLVVWLAKRVFKRSKSFQKIRAAAEQPEAQSQAQAPRQRPTPLEAQKLPRQPAAGESKPSADGMRRETLEESLAKHRKKVAQELALLQQYQEKAKK